MNNVGANTALFHSTGLGFDYYRFRSTGVFAATRYDGQGFETGIVGTGASGKLNVVLLMNCWMLRDICQIRMRPL